MTKFGVGQPVARTEDPRFLTGTGRYVDDINLPGQLYAHFVRSPHAHARIRGIDTAAAAAAPGVALILTGADAEADGLGGIPCMALPPHFNAHAVLQPVLVPDVARHVGDRVAVVIAETAAQARDAAELVEVDYEPLPASVGTVEALADGAPQVWPQAAGNLCFDHQVGDAKACDEAFARAAHVYRTGLVNNRISANTMEPRGALASYHVADRRYTLYVSCQAPHRHKQLLAGAVLHLPESDLRVIGPDVGGGFGMKGSLYPEDAAVVWATGKLGRPVKWISDRSEGLLSDIHGRDQVDEASVALDADGKILAVKLDFVCNFGAYLSVNAPVPVIHTMEIVSTVYHVPAVHARARAVYSHTTATGPYRGAGRPEAAYIMERLIDGAARQMGMNPVDIRRRNLIPAAAMPYKTPIHFVYDSGEFEAVLDKALSVADWDGFAARKTESQNRGLLRGIGIGLFVENSAAFNERMEARVEPGGAVAIKAGTFSHGQGHETVFAQMASDWLGVPFEKIRIQQGDTDQIAFGRGTYAARSITMGGGALKKAVDRVIDQGKRLAAHVMEAAEDDIEFADGTFTVAGTDKSVDWAALSRAAYAPFGLPPEFDIGLEATGSFGSPPNFPNGCHICEVEVDPDTGHVQIVRFSGVDDVGVIINPLLLGGQMHGAIAQGVGQALMENIAFDETGQLLSGSFMDYCMPRADDLPDMVLDTHVVPAKTNPLGVKGAGECGSVGAPPAVINAVIDALAGAGVTGIDMPATPERVWRALSGARAAAA